MMLRSHIKEDDVFPAVEPAENQEKPAFQTTACTEAIQNKMISPLLQHLRKSSGVLKTVTCNLSAAMDLKEKEIFLKAPWGKMAALTWGDSKNPPVLLCHGKLDVCTSFRPLLRLLPRDFFYVGLDLPGNGRSDHFPKGGRYTVPDFVHSIQCVKDHFGWTKFIYIGHSLGAVVGKYYNIVHPYAFSRMVELDPVPAHECWKPEEFGVWYNMFYGDFYSDKNYVKNNAGKETAPRYTYEQALGLMANSRGFSKEASEHILERCLEPAGDGLYRFTYDQRLKEITRLPFSGGYLKDLYTATETPIFAVIAKKMIDFGAYHGTPFITDEAAWPNGNYRFKIVDGGHDVHVTNPESCAGDISKFLLADVKAKL